MTSALRPRIGLLALTLDLYETLAPALRSSREAWVRDTLLPRLQPLGDLLFKSAVFQREDVDGMVAEYEAAGADALLVVLLTYSPSQLALPALQRTRLPIVIWNTQELAAVDEAFTLAAMIDNHGVHGTQDLANVLLRARVPFHCVTSHPQEEPGLAELGDFFAAAAAARHLRQTRIGLIGYPFPGMGDFAVDTTHLASTLGCWWQHLSVDDYISRSQAADPSTVKDLTNTYRRTYELAADLTQSDLEATARAELALRGLVSDHRLDALTYQFLAFGDDERTSTLPFVGASRLMADGVGFGGEGDLIAAAATAFFNRLQSPASFSEIFTIDFAGNSLFMSHMGEANVAMARRDRRIPLVARPTPITRTRDRQLALVTSFEPGPATFMALTQGSGGKWRIVAAPARIADYGPLPGFCVPHFKLQPSGDVREFLTAYAVAGGPHHNAVCFGNALRRLRLAAGLIGADYVQL